MSTSTEADAFPVDLPAFSSRIIAELGQKNSSAG